MSHDHTLKFFLNLELTLMTYLVQRLMKWSILVIFIDRKLCIPHSELQPRSQDYLPRFGRTRSDQGVLGTGCHNY